MDLGAFVNSLLTPTKAGFLVLKKLEKVPAAALSLNGRIAKKQKTKKTVLRPLTNDILSLDFLLAELFI